MVKRESGENPEQTRCCKLRQNLWIYSIPLGEKKNFTVPAGRRFKDGVSQKTCQNIQLRSFRGMKLHNGKVNHTDISFIVLLAVQFVESCSGDYYE
jgi:hypothetical protein